jgi:hypothetical protein
VLKIGKPAPADGVWIDEAYEAKMKTVTVKATRDAYFRILERHPSVRNVFSMGNHLVWVTPSGTALVIDTSTGAETMPDADIDALFTVAKKSPPRPIQGNLPLLCWFSLNWKIAKFGLACKG